LTEPSELKAIAFDAYGTLFDVHSVIQAGEAMFPGQGIALSQLWRAKQLEYSWLVSLMGKYEDFWDITERALKYSCKALSLNCNQQQQEELMQGYLHLETYAEVKTSLASMSSRHLAILSNGAPQMLDSVVRNAGLDNSLSAIISANEARIFKPNPRVYQLACDRFGLMANEIGFVSSNSWDVIGAKTFGFWTCWVNRQHSTLDELGVKPDLVVPSLHELAQAIS
jgi:2-haloacid dehalogenase